MFKFFRNLDERKLRKAGFELEEIEAFGLKELSQQELDRYMPRAFWYSIARHALNAPVGEILNDKWVSQIYFDSVGVKLPKIVGLWDPVIGMTPDGSDMRTPDQFSAHVSKHLGSSNGIDLFLKPQGGRLGFGALSATFQTTKNGGLSVTTKARVFDTVDTFLMSLPDIDSLSLAGDLKGWIVQHKVCQHPDLAALNPDALNTTRVTTYWELPSAENPASDNIYVDGAFQKIGRKGYETEALTDGGGLYSGVDPSTGRLTPGVALNSSSRKSYREHPDTGVPIEGFQLPDWQAAVSLCCKAARMFPSVRNIAWDIAYTKEGPILIEGNHNGNITSMQFFAPLLTSERRARFAREGVPLPQTQLPSTFDMVLDRLKRKLRPRRRR